jgi:hypothetical protein
MRRRRITASLVAIPAIATFLALSCSTNEGSLPGVASDASAGMEDGALDAAMDHPRTPYDSSISPDVPRVPVVSTTTSTRVDVQSLMFAAGEMQTSGEPFAQHFAGRNLAFYDRLYIPPDQYLVASGEGPKAITDLFGFSTAVESYEYSKYHMNVVLEQSGAGVSLAAGPLVAAMPQATLVEKLRQREYELMSSAGTDIPGYATLPPPVNNPKNLLGFAGLFPVFAPFKSFAPDVEPSSMIVHSCAVAGGYSGIPTGQVVPQYECEYNSLRLLDPAAQTEPVLVPAVLGFTIWKAALWAVDFTSRVHDSASQPVTTVADVDLQKVGARNNTVVATNPPTAAIGTYIGSNPLEGMWGLTMLAMLDNLDEWLLGSLTTADGATLGGFATKRDALAYDYTSPLRWFPAAINVTLDRSTPFPPVTSLVLTDAKSRSDDLAALLLGNALFFGLTDARNAGLGQSVGEKCVWDGDPFAADNGLPDGEETAHDRALGVMRVAFVDLDRVHADPALGVFHDTAAVNAPTVTRGGTVTMTSLAHSLIALRQLVLSLNGAITQYGSADPDPTADAKGILNALPIHPPGGTTPSFSARVRSVFVTNATFVRDVLTKADGSVANGAALANGVATPTTDATTLESQAAAIRALTEGFLLTGDETFRVRARLVVRRMVARFYSESARMFRGIDGGKDEVRMNAERFAWLQSALRETHKVLHVPADSVLGRDVLEDRIARLNKLILNGWDDLNGDTIVDKASGECLAGRLQMAEQPLTGELGRDELARPTEDRDGDCVLELSHAKRSSALAGEVFFHSP